MPLHHARGYIPVTIIINRRIIVFPTRISVTAISWYSTPGGALDLKCPVQSHARSSDISIRPILGVRRETEESVSYPGQEHVKPSKKGVARSFQEHVNRPGVPPIYLRGPLRLHLSAQRYIT